jgi:hypothetical protein
MENKTFDFGKTSYREFEIIRQELLVSGEKATMTYTNKYDKKCSMTIRVEANQYNRPVVVFSNLKYKYEYEFLSYRFGNQYKCPLKRID